MGFFGSSHKKTESVPLSATRGSYNPFVADFKNQVNSQALDTSTNIQITRLSRRQNDDSFSVNQELSMPSHFSFNLTRWSLFSATAALF